MTEKLLNKKTVLHWETQKPCKKQYVARSWGREIGALHH